MTRFIYSLAVSILILTLTGSSAQAVTPGQWAGYQVVAVTKIESSKHHPPVSGVVLLAGPRETVDGSDYRWWELQVTKRSKDTFAFRVLSEAIPMIPMGEVAAPGKIIRYILKEGDAQPVEYVHARTGLAYLPAFDFEGSMCPVSAKFTDWQEEFATAGTYLGHMLVLEETGDAQEWVSWPEPLRLRLDPEVVVYMSRMSKDTDDRYVTDFPGGDDYTYVPLAQEDVGELMSLGMNRFRVNDEQEEWVYLKPVFYYKLTNRQDVELKYPETLYRSNYRGYNVFIDEPAHHMGPAMGKMKRPEQAAHLITQHVEENWNRSNGHRHRTTLRDQLLARDVNLGTFNIVDDDYPIWETVPETSFYQLMGGPNGILHEGRWNLHQSNAHFERLLGRNVDLTVDEMLTLYYADLRGAARAFGDSWGTSIYGQCDPEVAPRALTLAYDMGARYFWFWATDKGHHLPYYMTKKLAAHLKEYVAANPRPPLDEMLHAPRTVIVLPYGYQVLKCRSDVLWGGISVNGRNSEGVRHREVVVAAIGEAIAAMRSDEDFDFAIDVGQDFKGYNRIVKVGLDGQVHDSKDDMRTVELKATGIRAYKLEPGEFEDHGIRTRIPYRRDLHMDGDLTEWEGADWLIVDSERQYQRCPVLPKYAGPWEGPQDLSARVAFARDENNLYMAAKVTDDLYKQRYADCNIWQGDGIVMALDLNLYRSTRQEGSQQVWADTFGGVTAAPRYVELAIAKTPNGPQLYMERCPRGTVPRLLGSRTVVLEHGEGNETFYEAAIPWSALSTVPAHFCRFGGLSFIVNDCDDDHRKGFLEFMPGIGIEKDPSSFALVEFEPIPTDARPDTTAIVSWDSDILGESEELKLSIDSMSDSERNLHLIVTLDRAGHAAAKGRFDVTVPEGRARSRAKLDTGILKPGVYTCRAQLRDAADDSVITESSFQVMILE